MKKIFAIALALALAVTLCFSGVAMADDPTTVTVDWSGAGVVDGSVNTGDAVAYFHSEGNNHVGEFTATDLNNNPYSYGVDTNTFTMETTINGTGWARLVVDRTDAYTPMYGAAGQQSFTYVGALNGIATLQNRSGTNYASMGDYNYGWHANDHITVTGADAYTIQRFMDSGSGNFAEVFASGTGDADLDCMSSGASAGGVTLGLGGGCYTNASFDATGTGTFTLTGTGNNSATTAMAPGMTGASSFQIVASWVSAFSVTDYSTTAN